ncbi:hypothetical protein [Nocardioides currus]|uniref:Uncharacterized protein n=1 Tax=Nocardioides currus TaxID=2133958 RepID=A0A2R7Z286_9ACTN|nr:hypothetical protein [Nocardioides currus]PUA82674.1 hypothetical protein C7S10_02810 [Nocardioides currus]
MTTASELATTPGVIPYVEAHSGPRRLLTVDLTTGNAPVRAKYRPIASIDGRQYVVVWGSVSWEIPADRNVHVSVHLEGAYIAQTASLILPPGDGRVVLTYATDYRSGIGSLG